MADRAESSSVGVGAGSTAPAIDEMILIIEDDPGVARLEAMHLRRAGFAVEFAANASTGIEAIGRGGIDLIVLDQNLQGPVSGLDFYEQLRASGDLTPAILVTGLSDEATLIRAVRSGLSDFVPKTVDYFDDLTRAVGRVISQIRTRQGSWPSRKNGSRASPSWPRPSPRSSGPPGPTAYLDFTNRRWLEYSGLTLEQTEGWNWCRALHPDDLDRVSSHWSRSLASGRDLRDRVPAPSRLRRRLSLVPGPGRAGPRRAGPDLKWFGTCTDIDDQKRNEEKLKRANDLAESASRAKDQFLAMLSHELRTPLTPVLLTATAARDDPETPPHLRETFEEIRQNLELEARLIDDLLDVMRIIRGKMPYQFEVVDAHGMIARAVEICRAEAASKGLEIVVELHASDHHVNADAARLQQVLWNLIKNAVKFTPKAGPGRHPDQVTRGLDLIDRRHRHRDRDRAGPPAQYLQRLRAGRGRHHQAVRRPRARAGDQPVDRRGARRRLSPRSARDATTARPSRSTSPPRSPRSSRTRKPAPTPTSSPSPSRSTGASCSSRTTP